ncbi:MAG: VWA domain-containing protein [Anaerolineales bacterium]|nr:VWA domain-containing protein [Anaerolineales bacterium]MCW5854834.1 VWA domain-containing protein [Anaerolineales bacterium]
MNYQNRASSTNPALVVFLIDISGSMAAKMPDGRPRHVVVQDALQVAISKLVQNSFQSGQVRPRYRLLVLAYSEEIWDIFGGIKYISDEEFNITELPPMTKTNPAAALEHVREVLAEDIAKWSDEHLRYCPAPVVIHLTDAEVSENFEDPEPVAEQIRQLKVPDGNVLLTNIYISPYLKINAENFSEWEGFYPEDSSGDVFGDKLLRMSSPLPEAYHEALKEDGHAGLKPGTLMFYPGINADFIKGGLVVSGASRVADARAYKDEAAPERGRDVYPE